MRAELSPVFGAGSCKSALDSFLGWLRYRWHTRCRTDDVTRCVPVSLSANRSEPVWCSWCAQNPAASSSTPTDLLKLPNPSSTLSADSMRFDSFFFLFCWKWVRQPIHWSINSGLFYQYIWLIYKCIMLKQKQTKQLEIINDAIHDFFFSFTFIEVPCQVSHGCWTWNVYMRTLWPSSKAFISSCYVLLTSIHCLHTFVGRFFPCSLVRPDLALVLALLYWCTTKKKEKESLSLRSAPWNSCMEVLKWRTGFLGREWMHCAALSSSRGALAKCR